MNSKKSFHDKGTAFIVISLGLVFISLVVLMSLRSGVGNYLRTQSYYNYSSQPTPQVTNLLYQGVDKQQACRDLAQAIYQNQQRIEDIKGDIDQLGGEIVGYQHAMAKVTGTPEERAMAIARYSEEIKLANEQITEYNNIIATIQADITQWQSQQQQFNCLSNI
jgi:uncharacterized phage infection (PIP) family protein YhgE